jgi:hypothetical protein
LGDATEDALILRSAFFLVNSDDVADCVCFRLHFQKNK